MGDVDESLPVPDVGRVDRGVEEIEGYPLLDKRISFVVPERAWIGQAAVDLYQSIEAVEIRRAAECYENVRVAVCRGAPFLVLHPIGTVCEMAQVGEHLGVTGKLAIRANFKVEKRLWCLDGLGQTEMGNDGQTNYNKEDDPDLR